MCNAQSHQINLVGTFTGLKINYIKCLKINSDELIYYLNFTGKSLYYNNTLIYSELDSFYYKIGARSLLVKIDKKGRINWVKIINSKGEGFEGLVLNSSVSIYYCTGLKKGEIKIGDSLYINNNIDIKAKDLIIAEFDFEGNLKKCKRWIAPSDYFEVKDMVLNNNKLFITGAYYGSILKFDNKLTFGDSLWYSKNVYLLSINLIDLTCDWVRTYGGLSDEEPYFISLFNDKEIILTGYFNSQYFVGCLDTLESNTSNFTGDIFLVKINESGTCEWSKSISSYGLDFAYSLTTLDINNIGVAGSIEDNKINFDDTTILLKHTNCAFISKHNIKTGTFESLLQFEDDKATNLTHLATLKNLNTWFFGTTQGNQIRISSLNINLNGKNKYNVFFGSLSKEFIPNFIDKLILNSEANIKDIVSINSNSLNMIINTNADSLILNNEIKDLGNLLEKYLIFQITDSLETNVSNYPKLSKELSIHPNPFSDIINIEWLNQQYEIVEVRIIDIFGRIVLSKFLSLTNKVIECDQLIPGLYIMQIFHSNKMIQSSIVQKY
ncbi:MAG: T9SS type A sorting domain-containing protein [Saprospiraceae bacterium]